ncbi:MAG: magnesium/cobalt transporter CorA [Desulfobacterales bacterium]|nr:magnesium/cobalt transporter CorA [Desulfobacterales bacterium]MBS3754645.1 magnesium/cobalt transporter CorA [Desulfobacterales bacterium]
MDPERVSRKFGMAPGSLVYIGDKSAAPVEIRVMDYTAEAFTETGVENLAACREYRDRDSVTWIDISGIHDPEMIAQLGRTFELHPLVLEDVLNTQTRPKLDDYEDYLFAVLKMIDYDADSRELDHEQVSLVIAPGLVISLQEKTGDVFDPVRLRIRNSKGRIRKSGADYLAYALIDMVVDHYFAILEQVGEQIETLQDAVIAEPDEQIVGDIHRCKHQIIFLRKSVWPVREIIAGLLRGESALISPDVRPYLRDVYDHTIQVVDTVETYRDILSGVLDIYLTNVSNRMNEVMKVLTVIATIFIPLTFLAGVYGMNFEYMPELSRPWAYPALWAIFLAIFVGLLAWFRRKKWL